jgi:hypothetical protein
MMSKLQAPAKHFWVLGKRRALWERLLACWRFGLNGNSVL